MTDDLTHAELMEELEYLYELMKNNGYPYLNHNLRAMELAIERLNNLNLIIYHNFPERFSQFFVCGASSDLDDIGLPERIHVCPALGSDIVQVYKKVDNN